MTSANVIDILEGYWSPRLAPGRNFLGCRSAHAAGQDLCYSKTMWTQAPLIDLGCGTERKRDSCGSFAR